MLHRALRATFIVSMVLAIDFLLSRAGVRFRETFSAALVYGFFAAQVGLCAVWLAIGRDPAAVQVPSALGVALGVWLYLANWNADALAAFGPGYCTQAFTVVVVLAVMRAVGFRLQRIGSTEPTQRGSRPLPRFSIRAVMLATLVIAVSVAILVRLAAMSTGRDTTLIFAIVGTFLGALTLMSVVSTLVVRHVVLLTTVTFGTGIVLGLSTGFAIEFDPVVSTLAVGTSIVLQSAVLAMLFRAGYRFMRCPAEEAAADKPATGGQVSPGSVSNA